MGFAKNVFQQELIVSINSSLVQSRCPCFIILLFHFQQQRNGHMLNSNIGAVEFDFLYGISQELFLSELHIMDM
jgi:hypothetical protein